MKNNNRVSRLVRQRKSWARLVLPASLIFSAACGGAALAQTALDGSELILPATTALTADMVILKIESAGRSGSYALAVSNTGPVAVTGAMVTDKAGQGEACPSANPLTITGGGVPSGSFTIANLSTPGIALGTLEPGQTASLTYSC